jgi:hypothetical protein
VNDPMPQPTVRQMSEPAKAAAGVVILAVIAAIFYGGIQGAKALRRALGNDPKPAAAPPGDGNIVPAWEGGSEVVAELWPNGKGGFYIVKPRRTSFIPAEVIRAEMERKAKEAAAAAVAPAK